MTRILNVLGLVRAASVAALEGRLRKSEARAAKLAKTLEKARTEAHESKGRAGDAERRAREQEREVARQAERVEKVRADLTAQLTNAHARVDELLALRERFGETQRDLLAVRDHLMAVETKLDILEAAANVLDGRTRTVAARSKTGTRCRRLKNLWANWFSLPS